MIRSFFIYLTILTFILTMLGCSKDDTSAEPQTYTDTYTVAVVVPGSDGAKGQWKSAVDWALENIEKAQQSCSHKVQLKVEMYDEETENIETLGTKLGEREVSDINFYIKHLFRND